ncbi:hypothetical protein FDI09_gp63 [Mycobacterium phage Twister]|uniref:Uncharacterized protein n=4 Tax=Fromanvirus TaxID=186764 RepID=H9NCK9_9CAUD|nr:hypothetical protein FDI09_gp63 [Mycobacterium phage Twister]YP_009638861.1 hypothetical protein FGG47_gp62 [Mycobacterium phage Rebeuca]QBP31982.1 hypothetical protein SEA_KRISTOFF_33 [Mycobacterium phage Kristoff]QGJ94710.1 membrane protein [Mycobacterium phage WalterMcMickey]AFF28330.1 hypothetical protein TWISTER_32 [Mycobacterium phage Twister]AFQ97341.1 hypothetical protein REBEUCA_33 [Mycobacterium phage Rebeuca]
MKKKLWENRHLVMAGVWATVTIPAAIWWPDSVLWVIIVSHWANFVGELAAHHSLKAEKSKGGDA